jgi:hypothetical protein
MSEEHEVLQQRLDELTKEFSELASILRLRDRGHEAVRQRFSNLVAHWKSERGHSSRLKDLVTHSAYQQIIGMGEPAIPLLLEEMQERPDHWDWALRAITGSDPVPPESWGKLREIAAAWVTWGKERGYIT